MEGQSEFTELWSLNDEVSSWCAAKQWTVHTEFFIFPWDVHIYVCFRWTVLPLTAAELREDAQVLSLKTEGLFLFANRIMIIGGSNYKASPERSFARMCLHFAYDYLMFYSNDRTSRLCPLVIIVLVIHYALQIESRSSALMSRSSLLMLAANCSNNRLYLKWPTRPKDQWDLAKSIVDATHPSLVEFRLEQSKSLNLYAKTKKKAKQAPLSNDHLSVNIVVPFGLYQCILSSGTVRILAKEHSSSIQPVWCCSLIGVRFKLITFSD